MLVTTKQFKELEERVFDLINRLADENRALYEKTVTMETDNHILQRRIKSLETELLSLDEDFVTHKKGIKASLINIAQKAKLKPKDLVTFDKKFQDFYGKVKDLGGETLTSLE